MNKREQIINYFVTPEPKFQVWAILVGLLCFLGGYKFLGIEDTQTSKSDIIIVSSIFGVLGIVFILASIFAYNKKNKFYKALPSDKQMDKWLSEDLNGILISNPLPKLDLKKSDLVADSLLVTGPVFWNMPGFNSNEIVRKLGNDGYYRYSIWTVQVFVFTENFLGSYKCFYNWLNNNYIGESTNEFFYKDVVSVKTEAESTAYTLMNGQRLEHAQSFQLNLSGDNVKVIINDEVLKTSTEMTSTVDKVVQSIRAMIRQKKS